MSLLKEKNKGGKSSAVGEGKDSPSKGEQSSTVLPVEHNKGREGKWVKKGGGLY